MPTPYPQEFRRDVIAVARKGDQTVAQAPEASGSPSRAWTRYGHFADRRAYALAQSFAMTRAVAMYWVRRLGLDR